MNLSSVAILISIFSLLPAYAHSSRSEGVLTSDAIVMVGRTYTATARFSQPLQSNYLCEGPNPRRHDSELPYYIREADGTWAGQKAYEAAALKALGVCKKEYNADCKVISASYRDIMSLEFIGFKSCEASVVVHGYRRR